MEKDHKNEATKMISSTTTDQKDDAAMNDGGTGSDSSTIDQKEVSGGDNVAMNPGSAKIEEDHQKEGGDDAALSDSSTLPLPFDSLINITPKKRKLEWILLAIGTSETETTSAETSSSKNICESPPGKLHTITLKAGEDVVDAIFELSKEYDHLRFVSIIAVIGSVSEVVHLDPNAPPNTLKGAFEINSLSVSCLADEDGRHCREKATCSVVLIDDKGKTIENISVRCLIAAGPLAITAATFKKPARETSASAAPDLGFYWLNNDSTLSLPLVSSLNITSNKRKEGPETETTTSAETSSKKRRGRPPGSGSKKKREEGPSETTTSAETSSQKRRGRPPGSSGGRFTPHVLILNAGEDLVDAMYNLSEAFPRRSVVINSATGSVSEFGILHPNGPPNMRQGIFQILKFVVKCLVDDDGHHCRAKARCGVILTDDNGNTFGSTSVNSLKAAGPVQIIASTFTTDVAKESGARILANAAVSRNDNSDSENINEVRQSSRLSPTAKLLPPTPPAAGGNINPTTTTTSAANDQDMKSSSDTCN